MTKIFIPPPESRHKAQARVARQQQKARRNPADLDAKVTILSGVGLRPLPNNWRGSASPGDRPAVASARRATTTTARCAPFAAAPRRTGYVIANLWDVRERKIGINRAMVQASWATPPARCTRYGGTSGSSNSSSPAPVCASAAKSASYMGQKTLENPVFEDVDDERVATGRLSPVYRLTEGLNNNRLRNLIYDALDGYAQLLTDPLPAMREEYCLTCRPRSGRCTSPRRSNSSLQARRRLAFEELFYIQLGVQQRRATLRQEDAPPLPLDSRALQHFEHSALCLDRRPAARDR
jgi:ATP-dependent DNA helicase RecG